MTPKKVAELIDDTYKPERIKGQTFCKNNKWLFVQRISDDEYKTPVWIIVSSIDDESKHVV